MTSPPTPAYTGSPGISPTTTLCGRQSVVRAAMEALAPEEFQFAPGWHNGMSYAAFLAALEDHGAGLDFSPNAWVPVSFLLAEANGEVVGRASIRHALNDWLTLSGGHIGYAVLAPHRRRGYATEILRQSLVIARAHGVNRVLVTCDDDNVGSATVIKRCGGVRDGQQPTALGDPPKRRYWIT